MPCICYFGGKTVRPLLSATETESSLLKCCIRSFRTHIPTKIGTTRKPNWKTKPPQAAGEWREQNHVTHLKAASRFQCVLGTPQIRVKIGTTLTSCQQLGGHLKLEMMRMCLQTRHPGYTCTIPSLFVPESQEIRAAACNEN